MKVATKIYSVSKGQASKRQLDDVMNKELKKTETIVLRVAKNQNCFLKETTVYVAKPVHFCLQLYSMR